MNILSKYVFGFLVSTTAFAAQEMTQGRWFEEDYIFVTNEEWQDVQGSWGRSKYNLSWDSYTKTLKGNTAGVDQELEFDEYQNQIYGESYCGWIQLKIKEVKGVALNGKFCDRNVEMHFVDKKEMLEWVKNEIFPEFVREFPEPARNFVSKFLRELVQPY